MIATFPDLFPDELLYSGLARYQEQMGFQGDSTLIQNLFSSRSPIVISDMPIHLTALVENFPLGDSYTTEDLINDHTLFPYYEPFVPLSKVSRIRESMGSGKNNINVLLGRPSIQYKSKDYFFYCPLCVMNDQCVYGEAYWHRIHQVPGVFICPDHLTWLNESPVRAKKIIKAKMYQGAESSILSLNEEKVSPNIQGNSFLLSYAADIKWLLSNEKDVPDLEAIRKKYFATLKEKGMCSFGNRIHMEQLYKSVIDFYSEAFFQRIQLKFTPSSLADLLYFTGPVKHPIYHCLLIHFLGFSLEGFFKLPFSNSSYKHFLWPCFNPVCKNYQKLAISNNNFQKLPNNKTVNVITCDCGFTYYLSGTFSSPKDVSKKHIHIIDYGSLWYEKLEQQWNDPQIPLIEIREKLGVSYSTLRIYAKQLGLSDTRGTKKTDRKPASEIDQRKHRRKPAEPYRETWLALRQAYPKAGIEALSNMSRKTYNWLIVNDKEWFMDNRPSLLPKVVPINKVDWLNRDKDWAENVKRVAETIKHLPGKPLRITTNRIAKELGISSILAINLDKLPITAEVLSSVVETSTSYDIRKIHWAYKCYCEERIIPSKYGLLRRASVSNSHDPNVNKIADEVYKNLIAGDSGFLSIPRGCEFSANFSA